MKQSASEFKKNDGKKKGMQAQRLIGPDQPFDYDDVAAITGPGYARSLHRDEVAVLSYEKLRTNFADLLVKAVAKPKDTKISRFQVADNYYHHIGHSGVCFEHGGRAMIRNILTKSRLRKQKKPLKCKSYGWILNVNYITKTFEYRDVFSLPSKIGRSVVPVDL